MFRWIRANYIYALTLFAMLSIAAGCGGGGGSSAAPLDQGSAPAEEVGEVFVGLTDAEGDFLKYSVLVQSLTLTRANGDVVETLPLATQVDFAELTEVTEFLTVATVPVGVYESASVRLDFSDAEIVVQDANGDPQPAQPKDDAGNDLGVTDLRLSLTTSDYIRVSPGVPAAFSLDFDLDASNEIVFAGDTVEVIVEPFLLATPELEMERDHRVRGVLDGVDVAANAFDLLVRPFRHRTGQFGSFTVLVDDATRYEVDGVGFTGPDGLRAMNALDRLAPVVTGGVLSNDGFTAEVVLAGSSVPWSDADVVKGVVAARQGDVLTVKGAQIEFADGTDVFRGTFFVNLAEDTTVTAPGASDRELTTQSISVGQRVWAWGEFVDDQTLNADRVRMRMNQLTAEVIQAEPLAVDLFFLNGRRPAAFDFAGTGMSPAQDADPDFYEIDSGLLPLATIAEGDLVRVRGLVNEFGAAPADYLASTVIDVQTDARAAILKVGWTEGTAMPFSAIEPARIDVDLSEARKALSVRGVPRAFLDELEEAALLAPASGRGVYAVKVRGAGEVHVYRAFADLVDELMAQLDAGRLLHRITAVGRYNVAPSEMTTARAGFVFSTPRTQE